MHSYQWVLVLLQVNEKTVACKTVREWHKTDCFHSWADEKRGDIWRGMQLEQSCSFSSFHPLYFLPERNIYQNIWIFQSLILLLFLFFVRFSSLHLFLNPICCWLSVLSSPTCLFCSLLFSFCLLFLLLSVSFCPPPFSCQQNSSLLVASCISILFLFLSPCLLCLSVSLLPVPLPSCIWIRELLLCCWIFHP